MKQALRWPSLLEGEIKKLTGSDFLTGRTPYAVEAVTFMPTHKLCLAGNHRHIITDTTHSMWRRPMLIGFDQAIHPDQQDKMLPSKLKQEGSRILNWLLAGLRCATIGRMGYRFQKA